MNRVACESQETSADLARLAVTCTYSSASCDLPDGRIQVQARGPGCDACIARSGVAANDVFEITGVPGSTPIPCTIRLAITGTMGHAVLSYEAFATSRLAWSQADQSGQARGAWDSWPEIDANLDLAAVLEANAPFYISYEFFLAVAFVVQQSELDGKLVFLGLPPEARVVSCHGFTQGPVAVELTTWAQVKSLYTDPSR